MVDYKVESFHGDSQDRTEPFSQTELDSRFRNIKEAIPEVIPPTESVPLDFLQVEDHHHEQGIRLLVRPHTSFRNGRSVSPWYDNCQWLALRAEVASSDKPEHKVLAVTQTAKDISFSMRIPAGSHEESPRPPLWCDLYYDPASDKIVFLNRSDVPVSLSRVSSSPLASPPTSDESYMIVPGSAKALKPGTWRIQVNEVTVLDFRLLEKPPVTVYRRLSQSSQSAEELASSLASSAQLNRSIKRSITDEEDDDDKRARRRVSDADEASKNDDVVLFFQPPADPLVFRMPKETKALSAVNGQALLDVEEGETVSVPAVCEVSEYQLTKRDPIASTSLSSVYRAEHSQEPNKIITVKVLKTRVPNPNDRPLVHERNVIRQADMWLRECQSQEDLQHDSIVRFYGGDARFLSLYMEHIEAQDLTAAPRWREHDNFRGTNLDARRILKDISNALDYIHKRKRVHNDIKPGNILYSPERGAVLCDFGLSTPASSSPNGGGTPYYVPPEFIGGRLRGPPSDVWALGVTMLYVLQKIPFPDSRARRHHHKPLYWHIAGVNNPKLAYQQFGNGQPAAIQMREWLSEVNRARQALDSRDNLERLVKEMLTPNPRQRISMADVLKGLGAD